MRKKGRGGIFALIRSRQDALNVVTDTSIVFLLVAAILAALYLIAGERTLLDVGLFGFLGVLLWRFKSPAAAITLLLASVMRLFVTLAQILDTGEVDWIFVVIQASANRLRASALFVLISVAATPALCFRSSCEAGR